MSTVTTRSQKKRLEETKGDEDLELPSDPTGPQSPSDVTPREGTSTFTPIIPSEASRGRVIDHTPNVAPRSSSPPTVIRAAERNLQSLRNLAFTLDRTASTYRNPANSVRSSASVASINALRKRAELEAAESLARVQETVIRKRLELNIAEIEAQREEGREREASDDGDDENTRTGRVRDWIADTPTPLRRIDDYPPAADGHPLAFASGRREHKAGPGHPQPANYPHEEKEYPRINPHLQTADERQEPNVSGVAGMRQMVEAIEKIARPRPVPKHVYDLPTFSGDPAEWLAFKRSYWTTSAMNHFKPYENIMRLQAALRGAAKIAVEDILRICEDPQEIMTALEEEFGHPNALLECAIKKIRNLPRISDNGRELSAFTNSVRNCASLFRSISADGYLNNPQLIADILNKLTVMQRVQYGTYVMDKDCESATDLRVCPSLDVLVDFLTRLSKAAQYSAPMATGAGPAFTALAPRGRERPAAAARVVHKVCTHGENGRTDSKTPGKCALCNLHHPLPQCDKFKSLSVNERWEIVKANKLCFKCLVKSHSRHDCRAKRCFKCRWNHHTLLHGWRNVPRPGEAEATGPPAAHGAPADTAASERSPDVEAVTSVGEGRTRALLKILPVTIIESDGREMSTYALLDDGATVSIVDASCAADAPGPVVPLRIVTARGQCIEDGQSRRVTIHLRGPNGLSRSVRARTMQALDLPTQTLPPRVIQENAHLRPLGLAAMEGAKPMLLLGQDNWELIVGEEIKRGRSGKPVASLTKLGWVVHGPLGSSLNRDEMINCVTFRDDDLHQMVKQQFEMEAIGVSRMPRKNTETERALRILDATARRVDRGWQVGLLWNRDTVEMPDNYEYARKRLVGIERKMDADPSFATAYCAQVNRLLQEGYAERVDRGLSASPVWYLPHFGVVNPNKPGKLRLVFDAAATCKGTSLNDILMSGPDLLNSLVGILMRFRSGPVGFTGDITDMFLRVKIRQEDRGAQLFLWRGMERTKDPDIMVMSSMIFGATSSPASAIYVLNRNAEDYQQQYPEAVEAIRRKHYMDDYLDSVDTVEKARQLIDQVTQIHHQGGFHIRGWVTNSSALRACLPAVTAAPVKLERSPECSERTLGLIWVPDADRLTFDLSFKRLPAQIVLGKVIPTKREFLSFIMSIFDPLGFLYPCVIQSRIIMQCVWKSGIGWEDQLREPEAKMWTQWLSSLEQVRDLQVPRWHGVTGTSAELHVFADASEAAYAAVAYLVGEGGTGERTAAIVMGKARVAPVRVVSIPRLELQAAVLACRLAVTVKKEIGIPLSKIHFWSDSRTVLAWISNDSRDYQKFVSHRLSEIDESSDRSDWRWIPSALNPADEATKLSRPSPSFGSKWISGPLFLRNSREEWPSNGGALAAVPGEAEAERLHRAHTTTEKTAPLLDITRFSSWLRALRAMARVLTFIERCRGRRQSATPTAGDMAAAERHLLREAQSDSYHVELRALRAGRALPPSSRLRALDPMLYEDGLLRVRGRLGAAPGLSFDERHPIILDGHHHAARLIVLDRHVRAHHAHHEAVVNSVRERYWITHLRPTVKAVTSGCTLCRLRRARPRNPKMGDLPPCRLTDTRRAFVHCGLDYFGPMEVAIGRRREKRWGVLFTCLATRAVHLDLAASLSADSTILALRRLIARRGQPTAIYSDRGTNFVGADRELRQALRDLPHDDIAEAALTRGIDWRFNPPAAPHMGGAWERLVRAVKTALRVTLRERAPREEVLMTLLLEAELVVNSRPLTYVTDDPEQPTAITPNHLLLGTGSGATTPCRPRPQDIDARSQWRRANALADLFWQRWRKEYLPTLQRRAKWTVVTDNVKCGDICLICDKNVARGMWPLGRIVKVYPGSDGVVRVVDVKVDKNKIVKRPVTGLIVLPTDLSDR